MTQSYAPICPRCARRSPTIVKGLRTYCTTCGAERLPFGGTMVNVAGKPSRVGGTVAKVFGGIAAGLGIFIGAVIAIIASWLFPGTPAYLIGVLVASLGVLVGGAMMFGGRKLSQSGEGAERQARVEAIRSLAAHKSGAVTAAQVAAAIDVPEAEADELLTSLAKDPSAQVSLELDDDGGIYYTFAGPRFAAAGPRMRVGANIEDESAFLAEEEAAEAARSRARRAR